jgi:uncharacterized membrane protein YbhN (UPF0104 family)
MRKARLGAIGLLDILELVGWIVNGFLLVVAVILYLVGRRRPLMDWWSRDPQDLAFTAVVTLLLLVILATAVYWAVIWRRRRRQTRESAPGEDLLPHWRDQ